jgi:hypothetical protein
MLSRARRGIRIAEGKAAPSIDGGGGAAAPRPAARRAKVAQT